MTHHRSIVVGVALAALLAPPTVRAGDANLDPSFGSHGVVEDTPANIFGKELLLQADGKLVVVGTSVSDMVAVRYESDGAVDGGFGSGGIATADFGAIDDALGGTVQSDGKIVAVGYTSSNDNAKWALARFDVDGTLDAGFGSGGKVVLDPSPSREELGAVVQQPDGKLVVVGRVVGPGAGGELTVARFNADGTLDTSFGNAGMTITGAEVYGLYYTLALQPDGKIVAAGGSEELVRVNADGSLDTGFGSGGIVETEGVVNAVLVQSDGKIVAGGGFYVEIEITRLNPDGTPDPSFADGGEFDVYGFGGVRRLLQQPDGKLVVTSGPPSDGSAVGLLRFETDGTLDTTFGSGGKINVPFDQETRTAGTGLVRQADGKLVEAAYTTGTPHDGPINVVLLRFGSSTCGNGTLDAGEACDDGNLESRDCCDLGCGIGGCGRCGTCNAQLECVGTPEPTCQPTASHGATLMIRDDADDTRDALKWKLAKGPATTFAQLGNPAYRDDYDFCVYDESGPMPVVRYEQRLRGGEEGWNVTPERRYSYYTYLGDAFGVEGKSTAQLRSGPRTRAVLRSEGSALRPPALPLGTPLRVQLRGEAGACFEATYSNASRNDPARFGAKSD